MPIPQNGTSFRFFALYSVLEGLSIFENRRALRQATKPVRAAKVIFHTWAGRLGLLVVFSVDTHGAGSVDALTFQRVAKD